MNSAEKHWITLALYGQNKKNQQEYINQHGHKNLFLLVTDNFPS